MEETFKKKLMDLLGSALALFIPVIYWGAIKEGASAGYSKLRYIGEYSRLWRQYNLAVILRPGFRALAGFVLAATVMTAPVFWCLAPDDVSWVPYWCWLAFNGVLVIGIVVIHLRLWHVRSISTVDFDKFFADRDALLTRGDLTEPQRARALGALNSAFRVQFGPAARHGLQTAARLLTTIPLQAIGMMAFASAISGMGVSWVVSAIYVLAALLLAGVGLTIALSIAMILGTTLRVVASIAISLFKGGWDSTLTILPNIQDEEAKELLEKDLGKKLQAVWQMFQKVVMSEPGKASVGLLALFIVWHHPLEILILTLLFIGLTFATGFEHLTGNKVAEKVALAGRIVAGFFLFGFLYRMAEMWRHGLGSSTWSWTYGDVKLELLSLWNRAVPWWNGLISMSWWQAAIVVFVVGLDRKSTV